MLIIETSYGFGNAGENYSRELLHLLFGKSGNGKHTRKVFLKANLLEWISLAAAKP